MLHKFPFGGSFWLSRPSGSRMRPGITGSFLHPESKSTVDFLIVFKMSKQKLVAVSFQQNIFLNPNGLTFATLTCPNYRPTNFQFATYRTLNDLCR